MHDAAYLYVRGMVQQVEFPVYGPIVEIGARNVNGSVRPLFNGQSYIGVDVADGEGVDIVQHGARYYPPEPAAAVVMTEVLEHTPEAEALCRHACEILCPGGVLLVTAAGIGRAPHSAVDGYSLRPGEFYANITETQLRHWLSDFQSVRIQTNAATCDIYATAVKA